MHKIIITIPVFLVVVTMFCVQNVNAQSQEKGWIDNFGAGLQLGRENGNDDHKSGDSHNSKCPPNNSLLWCAGYKVGYEKGWFGDN